MNTTQILKELTKLNRLIEKANLSNDVFNELTIMICNIKLNLILNDINIKELCNKN